MPQFYNNILVVTYEELVPSFFSSEKVLSVTSKRAEKRGYGIKRVVKGGNGHPALIEFDSLPDYIQLELGDPRKNVHVLEQFYKIDDVALRFYQDHVFDDGTYLDDDYVFKYAVNASVLQAVRFLKFAREYEIKSKGFRPLRIFQTLCSDATSFNEVLKTKYASEHSLPEHYLRFKELYQKFNEFGYKTLISAKHKNKNGLKVDDNVNELLNAIFTTDEKPSYIEVSRQYEAFLSGYTEIINKSTGEQFNSKEFPKLSQATIRNWLTLWENKVATFGKRSGNRQEWMKEFRTPATMLQSEFAGSIISVDDRQPPFIYNDERSRVWFYMGIDEGSECWTVWVNGTTKEGMILDFYRQMVRNYYEWGFNLPLEIECESSLNSNHKETFLMPGRMFKYVRIEANNARGKKIERFFRNLRYGREKKQAGWMARPFAKSESNQPGALQGEGSLKSLRKMMRSYNDIVSIALSEIEEWNNSAHSKHPEISRWEYFCSKQHPETKPINWRGILPYLGYKTPTSCNTGQIRLQQKEWLLGDNGEIYFGDSLVKLYQQVEGRQIDVYWLEGNDQKIMKALVYIDNQYICEALPKPVFKRAKAEQTENDLENYQIICKYVASIDGYINKTKGLIDEVLLIGEKPKTISDTFKINGAKVVNSEQIAVGSKQIADGSKQNIIVKENEEVEELVMPDEEEEITYIVDKKTMYDRF